MCVSGVANPLPKRQTIRIAMATKTCLYKMSKYGALPYKCRIPVYFIERALQRIASWLSFAKCKIEMQLIS